MDEGGGSRRLSSKMCRKKERESTRAGITMLDVFVHVFLARRYGRIRHENEQKRSLTRKVQSWSLDTLSDLLVRLAGVIMALTGLSTCGCQSR
ncbi:hypothetical protein AN958_04018 [Leucoagaricus sp. SymC.cos]|nr:hypothetical protein AN958_04018 [Leucoagaricus sp. SymC.cos]